MEKDMLVEEFKKLSFENDSLYTIKLRDLVINCSINQLQETYLPIICNKKYNKKVRFAAYYSVFIFYRRFEHHSLLYELVEMYSDQFDKYKLNSVVLSQYYKFKFLDTSDDFAIESAIKYAKLAVDNLNDNAGVLQNYAELVACALEVESSIGKEHLIEAIKCIDKAMLLLKNYPKHYCTKGRLVSWTGDYDTAKQYIRRAIDLESSDNKDSLIRIAQYNDYYIDIKTREVINKMSNHLVDAERTIYELSESNKENSKEIFAKLDVMQTKYLEQLAFFTGIIALILSVIEIVSSFSDFNEVAGIIMIMGGVLILCFGVLRCLITFHQDKIGWKRGFCIFFFSFILICLGYGIGNGYLWR